jgi:hypothetical protein
MVHSLELEWLRNSKILPTTRESRFEDATGARSEIIGEYLSNIPCSEGALKRPITLAVSGTCRRVVGEELRRD